MPTITFGTSGWRAFIADDFTYANVRLASQAIADHLIASKHSKKGVLVSYDPRFLGRRFAMTACEVLAGNKIKSYLTARDTPTPVVAWEQIRRGLDLIMNKGHKRVGILGFSFKAGTDDLRESPLIEVIERLIGKGYELRIYDKNVKIAALMGANRDFLLNRIPHISRLMVDGIDRVLEHAQTIVIGNKDPEFKQVPALMRDDQVMVDFVRIADRRSEEGKYDGICW